MPISEIDEIFSTSKGKSKLAQPIASSSTTPTDPPFKRTKKKGKGKKRKRDEPAPAEIKSDASSSSKCPQPETVFDPSSQIASAEIPTAKRPKMDKAAATAPPIKAKKHKEDQARFKDSRGSGPRRKTEEGFAIYKEDELGIKDEGGDTPLCPFDCDCCF